MVNVYFCQMQPYDRNSIFLFFRSIRSQLEKIYETREAKQLAMILFEYFANVDMKEMIVNPGNEMDENTKIKILDGVERLLRYEPVQYITGLAYFCGNEFFVNSDVLIPRPETEELVRWILDDHAMRNNLIVADIGTGSGCIAISLWLRLGDADIDAFDNSQAALRVAAENNASLGAGVKFYHTDFLNDATWPQRMYDVVASNPPYIPKQYKEKLPAVVKEFEPSTALFVPDEDPLVFYRALSAFAKTHLKPAGVLYVEVHEAYAAKVVKLFKRYGYQGVTLRTDIHDKPRMVKVVK